MDIMIRIGISSLKRENGRVGRSIELNDSLHGQRAIDEIWWFIVDIFHLNDDSLIVRIYININK